jgi:hypothetical protein
MRFVRPLPLAANSANERICCEHCECAAKAVRAVRAEPPPGVLRAARRQGGQVVMAEVAFP